MKLQILATVFFGMLGLNFTSASTIPKEKAADFLGHNRVPRKVNMPWEYKESPWEQAREYVSKNKRKNNYRERDVHDFYECTEEYDETYEDYDEAMENRMDVRRPNYYCKVGNIGFELSEFIVGKGVRGRG